MIWGLEAAIDRKRKPPDSVTRVIGVGSYEAVE